MYCPYSTNNALTEEDTVLLNDGTTYSVEKINSKITNDHDYVIGSSPAPNINVLAFIVSLKSPTTYTCNDIAFSGHKFQLPDSTIGRVEAITSDSILASDIQRVEMYSMEQENDQFNETLSSWSAIQPERFVVSLKSSDIFDNSTSVDFLNTETGVMKEIYIHGENTTPSLISSTTPSTLNFENVTLIIKNLNITGEISINLDNVNLYIENSSIRNINANNSKVTLNNIQMNGLPLSNNPLFSSFNSEIILKQGSENTFSVAQNNSSAIFLENSKMSSNNTTVNFSTRDNINAITSFNSTISYSNTTINLTKQTGTPNSLFYIDSNSVLTLNNNDINQVTSLSSIYNDGKTLINNTSISLGNNSNNGIILGGGSKLEINNTNLVNDLSITNKPIIGINDLGALYIGGANNNIYAKGSCVFGDIFTKELPIIINDDTVSSVNADLTVNAVSIDDEVSINLTSYFNKFTHSCY